MKRSRTVLFAFLAMMGFLFASDVAPLPPKPVQQSFVFDYGHVLNEKTIADMQAEAEELRSYSGAEVTVVTLESIGDRPLEEASLALLRDWGIGDKKRNNGLLLLVIKDRMLAGKGGKVRLEVGYGLEGVLPDGKCGAILDQYFIPRVEAKAYDDAIRSTFDALLEILHKEYDAEKGSYRPRRSDFGEFLSFLVILLILFLCIFCRRGGGGRYRSGGGFRDGGFRGGGFRGGGGGFGGFGGGSGGGGGASR